MKRIFAFLIVLAFATSLTGCSSKVSQEEYDTETNVAVEDNELLHDPGFIAVIYSTFDKIGINVIDKDIYIVDDNELYDTRSVTVIVEYDGINMEISLMYVSYLSSPEWTAVSIRNQETQQYYWVSESSIDYVDIYDWKTGELLSEKAKDFE